MLLKYVEELVIHINVNNGHNSWSRVSWERWLEQLSCQQTLMEL